MTVVLVWVVEGTWPACVDAARTPAGAAERTVLLHVTDAQTAGAARGAYAGLLGRTPPPGHLPPGPAEEVAELALASSRRLLAAARERLGVPCALVSRTGRPEREVVAAAEEADLLVCARDGGRDRPGPHSLGPATRFVVDHAPSAVLLVWPDPPPDPHPGTPPGTPPGRPPVSPG
ncbi:universal stress protein [Streptomyces sp. NPDC017979]|uniref:universal stress protein n=1 Tax=Streptomyces sp. NPDC017979 TaxID=3365024 RepID=UPI0037B22860